MQRLLANMVHWTGVLGNRAKESHWGWGAKQSREVGMRAGKGRGCSGFL